MRMNVDDKELALAAAGGDGQAFGVLLRRHYDRLYALCFRLTGTQADAEDLTQDICAALPAKLTAFRGDAKFTTWLYRVAVNASHDRRRRQQTHARHAEGWGDWEVNRQETIREEADAKDWLAEAMTSLPQDLRDTLALTMDQDMTQAQAAEVLGVTEGTVSWRISEVKKRLKALHEKVADT